MQTRSYRATLILDTRSYQDSVEALIENIKAKMTEVGAVISDVVNRGQIKFQRAVDRKFPAGLYLQIAFQAPSSTPELIRSKFRLDRAVNRIMIENR